MLNFERIIEEEEDPDRHSVHIERGRRTFWGSGWKNLQILRNPCFESRAFGQSALTRSPTVKQPNDMKTAQRWIVAIFGVITTLTFIGILFSGVSLRHGGIAITLDLDELTERDKCPACFGVSVCPQMLQGKIQLNDWTKYHLTKLVNLKNIFYATWKMKAGERQLILKKLAHDHELAQLDREICGRHHGMIDDCDVTDSVRKLIDKYSHPSNDDPEVPILHGEKIGKVTDILQCPSHNKMDYIIRAVTKRSRGPHPSTIRAHILTMLLINPEPLILQTFPAEEGWPFPIYYGACGRIVAEEYVGEMLTSYYKRDFRVRAKIAANLLNIAFKLSNNSSGFTLYMTDVSPDNFAVSEENYTVKVIDLENIIIVDKSSFPPGSDNSLYVSFSAACVNRRSGNKDNHCFRYSPDDLCSRPKTDHNFYGICAGLLASTPLSPEFPEGLLHTVPPEVKNDPKFSKMEEYLAACNVPVGSMNRIEAAEKLLEVLNNYIGLS